MSTRAFPVLATLVSIMTSGALMSMSSPAAAQSAPLADSRWFLVDFQSMDDAQGRTDNPRPLAYTLTLGADGRASLRLDCNRGQGDWSAQPTGDGTTGSFALGPLRTTRALCPDDSLGPGIARDAQYIRGYRLDNGRLHLSLMADGGIYTWAPLQQPSFDCERADSSATELICTDPDLAALDRALARLYSSARKHPGMNDEARKTLVTIQRGWIKGRDDCWKADDLRQCVLASMLMRMHELRLMGAEEGDGAIGTGPFALDCADETIEASVSFATAGQPYAYLQWNTEGIAMAATPTASGSRYQGEFLGTPIVLWTKANEARITHGEASERTCRLTPLEH